MAKKTNQEQEQIISEGKLNEIIEKTRIRENGSLEISWDYSNCPTLTEQHTAHLSDLNYLIEKFKPDELSAYLAARSQYRHEILGHDFSIEPNYQEAQNMIYASKKAFLDLPDDIRTHFKNHLEFLKFIDNPDNKEKMIKMGILKEKQIQDITQPTPITPTATPTPPENK